MARWLAGLAVALTLEERSRYLESGSVARQWPYSLKNVVDILESGAAARWVASGFSALRTR